MGESIAAGPMAREENHSRHRRQYPSPAPTGGPRFFAISNARAYRLDRLHRPIAGVALILLLGVLALAAPINHDEDQYAAATLLTATLRPFADFIMVQSPLQALLTAPLTALTSGWSFIALREANALVGGGLLFLTYLAARRSGATAAAAMLATVMLLGANAFLFTAGVFRNDLLPAALEGLSIIAVLAALKTEKVTPWLIAGLAAALAVSAKISYVVPLAAIAVFLGWHALAEGKALARTALPFIAGTIIGLAPILFALLTAPAAAWYGMVEFPLLAPKQWYDLNGYGWMLTPRHSLVIAATTLTSGPALLALIVVSWRAFRHRPPLAQRARLFLQVMTAAGLVTALLPMPSLRQYYIPLLLPLFALFALEIRAMATPSRILVALAVLCSTVSLGTHLHFLTKAFSTGDWPALGAVAESRWVGRMVRQSGVDGPVATLTSRLVLDSGLPLDRRFPTGPFAYRSGDLLTDADQRAMHLVSPRTLDRTFRSDPPAAIVTGYESYANLDRIGLELPLRQFALAHGYRRFRSPFGAAELFVRQPTGGRHG